MMNHDPRESAFAESVICALYPLRLSTMLAAFDSRVAYDDRVLDLSARNHNVVTIPPIAVNEPQRAAR
jgi:hypothetical protein